MTTPSYNVSSYLNEASPLSMSKGGSPHETRSQFIKSTPSKDPEDMHFADRFEESVNLYPGLQVYNTSSPNV